MMNGGMSSMMGWMMGIGLLGWVLLIALLITIVFLLARLVGQNRSDRRDGSDPDQRSAGRL